MVAIKNLLLVAATASALVIRDISAVLADLKTTDSDVNKLTSAVNGWNGQVFTATTISSAESQVESDVKKAGTDAKAASPATATDSQTIIDYINNTLEPDISKSITALINKKSQFQSAGLAGTVHNDLVNLKNETDSLGSTLISKADSTKKSAAQSALAKVDADFNRGLSSFP